MKKILLGLLASAICALGIGVAPTPAAAASACHTFSISVVAGGDGFSPIYTVPSSSACADIQVNHMTNPAHAARGFLVLFYPSAGDPFVNEPHTVPYNSATWTILATDVLNGTRFSLQEEKAGAEAWTAVCKD